MTLEKLEKTELLAMNQLLPFRVLNPDKARQYYTLELYKPAADLDYFVQLYWVMRWNLGENESFDAEVIPSAYTNFTCMPGGARITGVSTGLYRYTVQGSGVIFGVMFKPGGLHPFYNRNLSNITDAFIPASRVFERADGQFNEDVLSADDMSGLHLMINLLTAKKPTHDPNIEMVNKIIARAQADTSVSVTQLAQEFSMNQRTLQKLFTQYVGVGLKWIILRDRLQKATLIAETNNKPKWAEIASELGYNDQAHFINDFKRITGMTPRQYAKNQT